MLEKNMNKVVQSKKIIRIAILLIFVLLVMSSTKASILINENYRSHLGEAYGYLLAQNLSIEFISEKYPDLKRSATLAQLNFDREFRDPFPRLESMLTEHIGSYIHELKSNLIEQEYRRLVESNITRTDALNFIKEVELRAKGEIASPIYEYLLAVTFNDNPADEMYMGHRQTYNSLSHPKSRGLNIQIEVPASWAGSEARRPHIIRQWRSIVGSGTDFIMLLVYPTNGLTVDIDAVRSILNDADMQEMIPEGSLLLGYGYINIERQPGYYQDLMLKQDRVDISMLTYMRAYTLFYNDHSITIQCSTFGMDGEDEKLSIRFEAIKPLCLQVANSLVLLDLY